MKKKSLFLFIVTAILTVSAFAASRSWYVVSDSCKNVKSILLTENVENVRAFSCNMGIARWKENFGKYFQMQGVLSQMHI